MPRWIVRWSSDGRSADGLREHVGRTKEKVFGMSKSEPKILRLPEVARLTGLSKGTIHRRYREGTFPRPLKLGAQSIGWRREEVLEWLESLSRVGEARDALREADQKAG